MQNLSDIIKSFLNKHVCTSALPIFHVFLYSIHNSIIRHISMPVQPLDFDTSNFCAMLTAVENGTI